MPTYEYVCDACEHAFEEFQSMSAKTLKKCPACGKTKLRRLIGTGAGVIFKGSGFYETDYRSDSYQKAAKADQGGGESKSDSQGESKGDSKGESKSDSKPAEKTTKTESKPAAESKPAPKSDKPDKSTPKS